MIKPFSLRGSGKCNAGHASGKPSSPAMPFMSMPLAWRRQDAIGSAHVAATPLQDAAGSQAYHEIGDPWRWCFLKANIEAMVVDPKTKDKNLEWLILFSHYFLSNKLPIRTAFQNVQLRFDEREGVARYCLGSGLSKLEQHLHTASSFLSYRLTGCELVAQMLTFLDARHVTNMSAACVPLAASSYLLQVDR